MAITDLLDSLMFIMNRRPFLADNPVVQTVASGRLSVEAHAEAIRQYCRFPEEIADILLTVSRKFPRRSGIRVELCRNVGEEQGVKTGGIAHVNILKFGLMRDMGIDATGIEDCPATRGFLVGLQMGAERNPSFALGVAYGLEATAVPELGLLLAPILNAYAKRVGRAEPIAPEAMPEDGTYPFSPIIRQEDAFRMSMGQWIAMHTQDFEVGHRDNLRREAEAYLEAGGDYSEFSKGFRFVLDLMDDWWQGLAAL